MVKPNSITLAGSLRTGSEHAIATKFH